MTETKALGYTFFIDRETNELLKTVFKNALKGLDSNPAFLASKLIPGEVTEANVILTNFKDGFESEDMKKKAEIFIKEVNFYRTFSVEVNKLIETFILKEHEMDWCTNPECPRKYHEKK